MSIVYLFWREIMVAYQWEELPGVGNEFPILARRRIPSWDKRHGLLLETAAGLHS